MYICICVYICICTDVYISVYIYVNVYLYIHVYQHGLFLLLELLVQAGIPVAVILFDLEALGDKDPQGNGVRHYLFMPGWECDVGLLLVRTGRPIPPESKTCQSQTRATFGRSPGLRLSPTRVSAATASLGAKPRCPQNG